MRQMLAFLATCQVLFGTMATVAISAQSPAPAVVVAQVLEARGGVEIRQGENDSWSQAPTGKELLVSDVIRTQPHAFARLKFASGILCTLKEVSVMRMRGLTGTADAVQVRLDSGKAVAIWTPDRSAAPKSGGPAAKPPTRSVFETPSGLAAIQGTEWSISVDADGRTALVVLEGSVELSNALGAVTVGAGEAGEMRVGLPPTLMRLINPRDRVQWVADYAAQPLRFADASIGSASAELTLAAADAAAGLTNAAIERLEGLASRGTAPAGVVLALTDLLIAAGDLEQARSYAEAGRTRHPADARFDAMLSRIALFDVRTADSRVLAEQATAKDATAVEGWLALGESARSAGDGPIARQAFQQATAVNPTDARGWFGRGSVETDYEAFVPARRWLNRALELDPKGPGYHGEMGTVETMANHFSAAKREFALAMDVRSNDYLAMTGRALLALKEAREEDALDLLLRATLIEPNYARAQVYLGVTYHRLRRHDDAVRALRKASELDAKDPLPYLMISAIYTDLYQPSLAMDAGRKAGELMPNLKSLNQLANTQKGTANLGNSVAFFGMEQWAQHLAQESYYPFWAGSHLFLGDRYTNEFARTSEYYQGLLADPTVFGGSPLFQTLLPRAGSYATGDVTGKRNTHGLQSVAAAASANGYVNRLVPIGYAVTVRGGRGNTSAPALNGSRSPASGSVAIGVAASPRWSFFATGAVAGQKDRFEIDYEEDGLIENRWSTRGSHLDAGVNFRPTPTSSLIARAGGGTVAADVPLAPSFDTFSFTSKPTDVQARYTTLLAGRHEFSAGVELSADYQRLDFDFDLGFGDDVDDLGPLTLERDLQSAQLYLSARSRWGRASFQADLFGSREQVEYRQASQAVAPYLDTTLQPRLGASVRLGAAVVRGVFQQRTRPWAASSTLGPVATAGVPLDEQYVQRGGDQRRWVGQLEWEWSPRLFTSAFAEHQTVFNRYELNEMEDYVGQLQAGVTSNGEPTELGGSLGDLRNIARDASRLNVTAMSLLEHDPMAATGTVSTLGGALNRVITSQLALSTQYAFNRSLGVSRVLIEGDVLPPPQELSFVPRHRYSLGATWVSSRRIYFSAETIYRSRRFKNYRDFNDPTSQRDVRVADWTARVAGSWESRDKRWAIEFTSTDLLSKQAPSSYSLTAKIRR